MQGSSRWIMAAIAAAGVATTAGCGSSGSSGGTPALGAAPVTKFDLASGCYHLRVDGQYVQRDGTAYLATGSDIAGAERFHMRAANLGRYLFYAVDETLMTASGSSVSATTDPADGSDWTFAGDQGQFTASTLGQSLAADDEGLLVLADAPATLSFEPTTGCTDYPEMPVGIDGPTFTGPAAGQPVIGFAEVHAHMGMGSELSDGSEDVGPSAGGVLYGQAINRFGAPAALDNCVLMHGPNGTLSAENILLDGDPLQMHDTQGWPSFIDWPKQDSFLHQQMYYRWVERAYKAGLRVMVVHGTTIEALCNLAKATYGDKTAECEDMITGTQQVEFLYDVQDYVDAQWGGPGEGWFRIVGSPVEARQEIANGNLAVIPGLEFSNLFHCRVTFNPDGSENSDCTREDIDREIDEAWALGVRQVFPFHDVDSALGGTGIFSSVLNYVGFTDTRGFWKTYDCPDGGEGDTYFYNAGAELESGAITQFNDPVTQLIMDLAQGQLPVYPPGRQCNARTVTELGEYAIEQIMKKGFVLDIDHAELLSKQYMLDKGAELDPPYPMVSGHGGHGGISNDQATQIIRQGGIIYPALPHGRDFVDFLAKLKPIWEASGTRRPFAVGYGADANGLRTLPQSRGASAEPIVYPFTLFQGEGWGSQFAEAGIAPLQVDLLSIPGGKQWVMDEEGMSHYGLVADIVEGIRLEGGEEAITALYNSAEAYLQLWEQTEAAAAAARVRADQR